MLHAVDRFGDLGNLSTFGMFIIGVGGVILALLGLWVRSIVNKAVAPILVRLDTLEHEHSTNGGIHKDNAGRVDTDLTTSKDLSVVNYVQNQQILRILRRMPGYAGDGGGDETER